MFDELSLAKLFAPHMIERAKNLLAGYGWDINPKGISKFTGYIGSYTVLTANLLAYPWIAPVSSAAGFVDGTAWTTDKLAIKVRCTKVYFGETFD